MVGKGCTRDHDNQPDGRNAEILETVSSFV